MFAVLEDAVTCYLQNMNQTDPKALSEFGEVNSWFNARNSRDLFAFESICEVFGLDHGALRDGLRAMRQKAKVQNHLRQEASRVNPGSREIGRVTKTPVKRPLGRRVPG